MKLAYHLPYLNTLIRSRWRSGVMSLGILFALLIPALVTLVRYSSYGVEDWYLEGYIYVYVMQGILLFWYVVAIGMACGRERNSGRLLAVGSSKIKEYQFLLGLLFGPAWVELFWAACLAVLILLLGKPEEVRLQIVLFLFVLITGLLVIYLQLPRAIRFKGHRTALVIAGFWICYLFSGFMNEIDTKRIEPEFIFAPLMGFLFILDHQRGPVVGPPDLPRNHMVYRPCFYYVRPFFIGWSCLCLHHYRSRYRRIQQ